MHILIILLAFILVSCSGVTANPPKSGNIINTDNLLIIIPKKAERPCVLDNSLCEYFYYIQHDGSASGFSKRDFVRIKKSNSNKLIVDRRIDNGISGSGKIYQCKFSISKSDNKIKLSIIPRQWKEYHEGLIFPFPIPKFNTENILSAVVPYIKYTFGINSKFNTESVYSNFERILKYKKLSRPYKDPVTGKIFNREFYITNRGKQINFFVEVIPYRNGSKSVFYIKLPSCTTSNNTVDFSLLMKEVNFKLKKIVND